MAEQRRAYGAGQMSGLRARRLEKLGMVWSVADERFQENLEAAKAYYEDHWTLCAPRSATALDRPVGQWLSNLRRAGALDGHPEWKAALEAVDPYWNPDWPVDWQRHYAALRELVRDEGQADVLPGVTVHGMGVGRFVAKNRQHAVWQGLMDGQRELLEAIGIEKGNLTALPELAREYAEDNTGARIVIVDRTGRLLTDSAGTTATGTTLAGEPDIAAALRNQTTVATRTGTDGGDVLAATMPGSSGTTIRGGLRVTYPMTMVTDREHRIWAALALAGACVLAAVALVAFTLARWITRPLRTLERATTQLAAGRLDNPPDAGSGPPELRRLAAAFTHTATRLQHLLQAQHSFASEASHQLKTPLTSLRLRLENFEPYLDPRAHPSLEETIAEVERLSRMVHGLLALARLENTATTPNPSTRTPSSPSGRPCGSHSPPSNTSPSRSSAQRSAGCGRFPARWNRSSTTSSPTRCGSLRPARPSPWPALPAPISTSSTRAPACRRPTGNGPSTASGAPPTPITTAPAWACPSSATSCTPPGARSHCMQPPAEVWTPASGYAPPAGNAAFRQLP
ncbi:hypothetical protein SAV31267_000290 [Streptomyces avermitilis]|uniref:histidine kinase n=1 Tax=Streptomyces avermitilis TaxID=33903 RepID=A0A4D4MFI0_STRAX|nr:hypothetical protein SAV31267_000290 [Streptomyces avermitilis]